METTKHIPGPWFFDVSPDNTQAVLVDADGNTVLYLSKPFPNTLNKEVRLIAAAPELLVSLRRVLRMLEINDARLANFGEVEEARSIISRAEGAPYWGE